MVVGILEGNSSNILRVEQNLWYIEDWRYRAIEKVTLSGSLQTQHKECIRVMNLFLIPNRDDYYEALRHFLTLPLVDYFNLDDEPIHFC